jgi:hypothetical protein
VQTPNIEGTVCPIPQASAPAGKKKPGRTKRGAAGQGNKGGVYKPQVFAKPVTSRGARLFHVVVVVCLGAWSVTAVATAAAAVIPMNTRRAGEPPHGGPGAPATCAHISASPRRSSSG